MDFKNVIFVIIYILGFLASGKVFTSPEARNPLSRNVATLIPPLTKDGVLVVVAIE